jgi:hypothetical protein
MSRGETGEPMPRNFELSNGFKKKRRKKKSEKWRGLLPRELTGGRMKTYKSFAKPSSDSSPKTNL